MRASAPDAYCLETTARCAGCPNLQSPYVSKTLPRNADVADQFDLLADLLELEGAESFRVLRLG